MAFFVFLFFFNILFLFFGQNILNLVAFYAVYVLLLRFYKGLKAFSSELEQSTWLELIRILILLRSWYYLQLRYSEYELFKITKFLTSFLNKISGLIKSQEKNIYINYTTAVLFVIDSIYSRFLENENFFDLYKTQLDDFSSLVIYL